MREAPLPPTSAADIVPDEVLTPLAEVSPQPLYVGQQALLNVTRFARRNMAECACEAPEVEGAWTDTLLDQPERPEIASLQGVRFERQRLRSVAIFPLAARDLVIPAVTVRCRTRGQGFFGAGSEMLTRTTAPLRVKVRPLPREGRRAGFAGAVGSFRYSLRLDRRAVGVNEPVTMQLVVNGTGNFRGFSLRPPKLPAGLRAYPPSQRDDTRYDRLGRLSGSKTLDLIVVPERPGVMALPAFEFPYFEPVAGAYRIARTRPMRLRVSGQVPAATGGRVGDRAASADVAPASAELPDLRPLRPVASNLAPGQGPGTPWTRRPLFWILLGLLPAAYLALLLRDGWRRVRERARPEQRVRGARRRAEERLAAARAAGPGPAALWSEVVGALHAYLEDRGGLPTLGQTRPQLRATLGERLGYPDEAVEELLALLDEADLARFAGGAEAASASRALERGLALLKSLDEHRPPQQPVPRHEGRA